MKVGSLVKWTYPGHEDHGIVVAIKMQIYGYGYIPCGYVHIVWSLRPEHSGYYPVDGEYLKLIEEKDLTIDLT